MGDDSSFQVSHIEHVKRDEILDDSLLFALGNDVEVKDAAPHLDDDTEDEGNRADLEMVDRTFFDQQKALQPEIILTPNALPEEQKFNFFDDLLPTSNTKHGVGEGLLIDQKQESNLSNEMAALGCSNKNASPGLMKQNLNMYGKGAVQLENATMASKILVKD